MFLWSRSVVAYFAVAGAQAYISPPTLAPTREASQILCTPRSYHLCDPLGSRAFSTRLFETPPNIEFFPNDEDGDDDIVEPGKMRVSEIKAELDLRHVSYKDCIDKESLVLCLKEVRATGKADPKILEKFNRQKLESDFSEHKVELSDEVIEQAMANDGTIPGGLKPDQFKKLVGNPEIMTMLQSSKMQEAMSLMMTRGPEELEKKLQEDPELRRTVEKLDGIMKSLN
jgi:hypothetical protein